ncbi:hypothetical protein ACFQ0X_28405 [Streptomyces rectiviolaceus]|uniref:hypothetical protein n=1 Tax=Streptomyces rectiviolaceus TaxID=332591 RepID=UPI0036277884
MRSYIGNHQALNTLEFEELALGFDELPAGSDREAFQELFRGPLRPESRAERAARLDVAREVLAELREDGESGDEVAAWDALYADALTRTVPLLRVAAHSAGTFSGTGKRHERAHEAFPQRRGPGPDRGGRAGHDGRHRLPARAP